MPCGPAQLPGDLSEATQDELFSRRGLTRSAPRARTSQPDVSLPHCIPMKKIGFLSFGHWTPSPQSQTRTASDALLQSIELAVAAEELGADGAFFRVHHYARQLGSPFPPLPPGRAAPQ